MSRVNNSDPRPLTGHEDGGDMATHQGEYELHPMTLEQEVRRTCVDIM